MKHRVVIHQINGKIKAVHVSGETEVYLVRHDENCDCAAVIEADEFEIGKAHEAFMGLARDFLKHKKV